MQYLFRSLEPQTNIPDISQFLLLAWLCQDTLFVLKNWRLLLVGSLGLQTDQQSVRITFTSITDFLTIMPTNWNIYLPGNEMEFELLTKIYFFMIIWRNNIIVSGTNKQIDDTQGQQPRVFFAECHLIFLNNFLLPHKSLRTVLLGKVAGSTTKPTSLLRAYQSILKFVSH